MLQQYISTSSLLCHGYACEVHKQCGREVHVQVLLHVILHLGYVFTKVRLEWLAVQVSVANVQTKRKWRKAGHVTDQASVVAQRVTHMVQQKFTSVSTNIMQLQGNLPLIVVKELCCNCEQPTTC